MAKISKKNGVMLDQDRKAYLGICQMLFNNELNPGQKLAYKDLAQRVGVSTTPVIHALKLLEHKGITRREPNKGYYINTITVQEVEEVFDSRIALEVSILPKTIQNMDQSELKKLQEALHDHDQAIVENDNSKRVMTDLRFHMTLASISQTTVQVKLLEDLFDRLLLKFSKDLFHVSIIETSQREHYAIMDAIKKKDLGDLTKALRHHLKETKARIVHGLSRATKGEDRPNALYHAFDDIKSRVNE